MTMQAHDQVLSSLLLPLKGFKLILPQSTVTEVASRPELTPIDKAEPWLIGMFDWRSEQVPLISYEALCGHEPAPLRSNARIAVLHTLEDIAAVAFYALELQAIPQPVQLRPQMMALASEGGIEADVVGSQTRIGGQTVIVPDLAKVEYALAGQLSRR